MKTKLKLILALGLVLALAGSYAWGRVDGKKIEKARYLTALESAQKAHDERMAQVVSEGRKWRKMAEIASQSARAEDKRTLMENRQINTTLDEYMVSNAHPDAVMSFWP